MVKKLYVDVKITLLYNCHLYRHGARCDGTFSSSIPSPLQIAESIKDEAICNYIIERIRENNTITASVFQLLDEPVDTPEQLSEQANTRQMWKKQQQNVH